MGDFVASEDVKRVQRLLVTLEEKKLDLERSYSDYQKAELLWKKCEKDLSQIRRQLLVELRKLDPALAEIEEPVPA